jgi:1-deoxy-D-xylulose-5-phosphate reductoisomerase
MKRKVILLGASGSIGTQTLEIIQKYPDEFELIGISVGRNTSRLVEILMAYPTIRYAYSIESVPGLVLKYPQIRFYNGEKGLEELASVKEADLFVNALVGFTGFIPSLRIIENGIDLALANKETLVAGGEIIKKALKNSASRLYPIDSEHSAIWQCLHGNETKEVSRLIITASGGSFRDRTREELEGVTVEQALHHPNWSMGAKITIDSATMMNKGFEMIEARWLFGVMPDDIEIVVHPQSIIHSMVAFKDGSVKAQLGLPDMHLPIRYALGLPDGRLASDCRKMTIEDMANLTLERPDFDKFPLLGTAYAAARTGGTAPCVMNAANEIAVAAFLKDEIGFTDIYRIIDTTMAQAHLVKHPTYDDYVASNDEARAIATQLTTNN